MLELTAGKYRVTVANDPTHTVGSADNVHTYDHEYYLDDARDEDAVNSCHAVRVFDDHVLIAATILMAGRGATGIHEHSAIIHNQSCVIAVGPFLASLKIPTLDLEWTTQTDWATCFGVYHSEKHHCFISHGELEISRVSYNGQLIWQAGGADIFTNGISIREDSIHVVDFNDMEYTLDFNTGREYRA